MQHLPAGFDQFHMFSSPAIRLRSRGRSSGEILVLVNKQLGEPTLLHITENWIFVKLILNCEIFIIGTFYFVPQVDIEPALESLQNQLDSFTDMYPTASVLLGGDFNSHIAADGEIPEGLAVAIILSRNRTYCRMVRCSRGTALLDFMEGNNFFCLNGRSFSDTPRRVTYLAATGSSTVDFIWIHMLCLPLVENFEVNYLATGSDHFPIIGTLRVPLDLPQDGLSGVASVKRLSWAADKAQLFMLSMLLSERVGINFLHLSLTELSDNFKAAIRESAFRAGITRMISGSRTI